jgi:hypothetical protein
MKVFIATKTNILKLVCSALLNPGWGTFIALSESAKKIDSCTSRFFSISQKTFVVKNGHFLANIAHKTRNT